ncbi:MAG TPA: sugar phosphate isomerase/epimerase [Candidatus Sulfopaludibacter sp.]|jgi:sugar phosphate isomerase/epimerase|nr:sugar phosphate isomerase/epimerase [Candidatus Sulfopaludibacter sp.]
MNTLASRRTFLGIAGAGLAASGLPSASAKVEPSPWGIKLGIATYTFREFPRDETIAFIKKLQMPWVSVKQQGVKGRYHWDMKAPAEEQAQIRKEFQDAGLKVMSAGNTDMKELTVDGLRPVFEWAKMAGVPMFVVAPLPGNIGAIETLVKQYDIKVAIHNHGPEDKNFPTPESVLEAVKGRDPRLGLCMDVGHSARAGADVVKAIAGAGSRLLDMHVKDLSHFKQAAGEKPGDLQCEVGEGVMPFPAIFKQLKKMNYQGCVNLEYEINGKNPMPGVQMAFSYMRGVLAGLASA